MHALIAGDLQALAVPIESLKLDPNNARLHDEQNLKAIAASLERFGQRKPVVVTRADRVVRAGNGTVTAARRLGWTHIAALLVDDDELTAKAFAIADNRTGELSHWDHEKLADLLREVSSGLPDLDTASLALDPLIDSLLVDHEAQALGEQVIAEAQTSTSGEQQQQATVSWEEVPEATQGLPSTEAPPEDAQTCSLKVWFRNAEDKRRFLHEVLQRTDIGPNRSFVWWPPRQFDSPSDKVVELDA